MRTRAGGATRRDPRHGTRIAPWVTVPIPEASSERVTPLVALVCADDALRARTVARLREAGAEPAAHATLSALWETSAPTDVVVVFADDFPTRPLVACLDALERKTGGPTLIVVTDLVPAVWTPKVERDEVATVLAGSVWESIGLALVQERGRANARGDSRPELPFTD